MSYKSWCLWELRVVGVGVVFQEAGAVETD